MGSKPTRKFPRYDVAHYEYLRGHVTLIPGAFQLQVIGNGGCGFTGSDPGLQMIPPKEITCSFSLMDGMKIEQVVDIVGELLYVRPANFSQLMYYGISFHPKSLNKIVPIVSRLEYMAQMGIIDRA